MSRIEIKPADRIVTQLARLNLVHAIGPPIMSILAEALQAAKQVGSVVAFDLDSTLFDNRPRSVRIFREFGAERGIAALCHTEPQHFRSWNLVEAMVEAGVAPTEAQDLRPALVEYWRPRFFSSEYCLEDIPLQGASDFVRAVEASQATIAYVTGRHEEMRPGTIESLRRHGFPLSPPRVHLIMKPEFDMHDDGWKIMAHAQLTALGRVVAAFDNEPMHINGYADSFPDAILVCLATDHSGRPVPLKPQVRSVRSFLLE